MSFILKCHHFVCMHPNNCYNYGEFISCPWKILSKLDCNKSLTANKIAKHLLGAHFVNIDFTFWRRVYINIWMLILFKTCKLIWYHISQLQITVLKGLVEHQLSQESYNSCYNFNHIILRKCFLSFFKDYCLKV